MHRASSRADHDSAMSAHITELLRLVGTNRGDVRVLVATNRRMDVVAAALRSAGIPVVSRTTTTASRSKR